MLQKVVNQNLNNNIYASGIQNSPLAILIQECAFDGYVIFVKKSPVFPFNPLIFKLVYIEVLFYNI